ncbi:MAG: aminopeptidase [Chloroflexota bacterium]|nr:aminopeptidase [Chloroflexota bacterium]
MDIRVERVARVLVHYSVGVKAGEWVVIRGEPAADPMIRAVYREVLAAGGLPQVVLMPSWEYYSLLRYGNDEQLDFISPAEQLWFEQADVVISISGSTNTRMLSNVALAPLQRRSRARAPLWETFMRRAAEGALRWVSTLYPTEADAQEAEMSLEEYKEFVYGAGLVDSENAIERWQAIRERQQRLVDWLQGREAVHIRGANVDLRLSIAGRTFINAAGESNFPDGEIYTGPVEDSAEGWVRFTYPALIKEREVSGIELTFEAGKVVKATATKNEEALIGLLETDPGARYLGELGIGTNPGIQQFTRNALFDEKIQGTFHLALGKSYPETGGVNESSIHEDIVCDISDGEILVDGEVFYRRGDFVA